MAVSARYLGAGRVSGDRAGHPAGVRRDREMRGSRS
jgi:hypothetical protein